MRGIVLAVCLVGIGCGTRSESAAKYDPVKDRTTISSPVRNSLSDDFEKSGPRIHLLLSGEGLHPKDWGAAIDVEYKNPKGKPDFWGKEAIFTIDPGTAFEKELKQSRYIDPKEEPGPWDDHVMFDATIEDLVTLIDQGGKFAINGKPFSLTPDEIETVRAAIIAAREDTNAVR